MTANEEDEFGHLWVMGWEESDTPHPGFGGSYNIYGGYVAQCDKCGIYSYKLDLIIDPEQKHCKGKYDKEKEKD